jgi:predicted secreted Zn-dependent protease
MEPLAQSRAAGGGGREPVAVHSRTRAALFGLLAALACAPNVVRREPAPEVRIAYYPVEGGSVAEIRRDLLRKGPPDARGRRRAARTDWSLGWRYAPRQEARGCVAGDVETSLAITTTLPSLSAAAPAAVRSEWSALASALAEHEGTHRAIALECRDELARSLARVRGADDCDALRRALDAAGRSAVAECRARAAGFDRETAHGARER